MARVDSLDRRSDLIDAYSISKHNMKSVSLVKILPIIVEDIVLLFYASG